MKKTLLISLLTLFVTLQTRAQIAFDISLQAGFPTTDYSGEAGMAAGAGIKIGKNLDDYLRVTVASGYHFLNFTSLNIDGVKREADDASLSIIPVTVGAEFYILTTKADKSLSKIIPYIGIDLGAAITMQSESSSLNTEAVTRTNFLLSPAFGIAYQFSDKMRCYAALKNNFILYRYRDILNWNEPFQLVGFNLGLQF